MSDCSPPSHGSVMSLSLPTSFSGSDAFHNSSPRTRRWRALLFAVSVLPIGLSLVLMFLMLFAKPYKRYKIFLIDNIRVFQLAADIFLYCICGFAIFFGFFGLCCAKARKIWIFIMIGVISLLTVVIGITAVSFMAVNPFKNGTMVNNSAFVDSFESRTHEPMMEIWNEMEVEMECCGIEGPSDYRQFHFNVSLSCCGTDENPEPKRCRKEKMHKKGCLSKFDEYIESYRNGHIFFSAFISAMQLMVAVIAFFLVCILRNEPGNYQELNELHSQGGESMHLNGNRQLEYGAVGEVKHRVDVTSPEGAVGYDARVYRLALWMNCTEERIIELMEKKENGTNDDDIDDADLAKFIQAVNYDSAVPSNHDENISGEKFGDSKIHTLPEAKVFHHGFDAKDINELKEPHVEQEFGWAINLNYSGSENKDEITSDFSSPENDKVINLKQGLDFSIELPISKNVNNSGITHIKLGKEIEKTAIDDPKMAVAQKFKNVCQSPTYNLIEKDLKKKLKKKQNPTQPKNSQIAIENCSGDDPFAENWLVMNIERDITYITKDPKKKGKQEGKDIDTKQDAACITDNHENKGKQESKDMKQDAACITKKHENKVEQESKDVDMKQDAACITKEHENKSEQEIISDEHENKGGKQSTLPCKSDDISKTVDNQETIEDKISNSETAEGLEMHYTSIDSDKSSLYYSVESDSRRSSKLTDDEHVTHDDEHVTYDNCQENETVISAISSTEDNVTLNLENSIDETMIETENDVLSSYSNGDDSLNDMTHDDSN